MADTAPPTAPSAPPTTGLAGPPPGATGRTPAPAVAAVVATDLAIAFGVVVGLNQLATQSPVDAVLPVALISVGIGGLLTLLAAALGGRRHVDDGPLGTSPVSAPTLDAGFAAFGLGLVALLAVLGHWGVAAQSAVVGAQGLRLLLQAEDGAVRSLRRAPGRADPFRLALVAVEGVVLVVFAVAALSDGGVAPFG